MDIRSLISIYETISASIDAGLHAVDSNGKTVIYNEKMREIEGMAAEDVLDRNILDVFHFVHAEDSTLLQVLATGRPALNIKQTYFNNRGQEITTVNNTFPVFQDGRLLGAAEIARDVTRFEAFIRSGRIVKEPSRTFSNLIGKSPIFREAVEAAVQAAAHDLPILISGETGTGKEELARCIHYESNRGAGPFLYHHCPALSEAQSELILFGKAQSQPGLLDEASRATLYLEEVSHLPIPLQERLSCYLRDQNQSGLPGPRLIISLNEDPVDAIAAGRLLKSLYYRINSTGIFLPALRERREDLPLLLDAFVKESNEKFGTNALDISEEARQLLFLYDWPGNLRELQYIAESACKVLGPEQVIRPHHLPARFRQKIHAPSDLLVNEERGIKALEDYLREAELYYLQKSLQMNQYNITRTAAALGLSRQNLQYRLRKHGIVRPSDGK